MAFDIPAPADPTPPRPTFDASSGIVGGDAVSAFEADGVVCLRRVVEPGDLPAILAGCEEARGAPTSMATTIGGDDGPGFFFDFDVSDRIEAFRRLRDDGPMPDLARQLMRSERVVRYFDNLFVKDGGGGAATPWHEEASFQRVNGADSINFWLAFDDIPHTTALQFLAGSHRRDEPIHLMGHFDDSGTARCTAHRRTRCRHPAGPSPTSGSVTTRSTTLHPAVPTRTSGTTPSRTGLYW